MQDLTVYILSHNRPAYLRVALLSVLNQSINNFRLKIIVSDNSESGDVQELMLNEFPFVNYKRNNTGSLFDHLKLLISELNTEFVVFFHDDDLMHSDYCRSMLNAFNVYTCASAIACNAYYMDNHGRTKYAKFNNHRDVKVFKNEKDLLSEYFLYDPTGKGVAPFPSYMYRKSALDISHVNELNGGKYSDCSFISSQTYAGDVVWLNECLMYYRQHDSSISSEITIRDYISLWRYMISVGVNRDKKAFKNWRIYVFAMWYLQERKKISKSILLLPIGWRASILHRAAYKLSLLSKGRTFIILQIELFLVHLKFFVDELR